MGTLRLLLALTVLNWHFPFVVPFNFIFSFSAVYIFLIISGFYMTMVITTKYGTSRLGLLRFYQNRAMRLFPVYYVALLGSVLFVHVDLFAGGTWSVVNQLLIVPRTFWLNLTLNPTDAGGGLVLGQMYTVALEMMFYIIAPLIVPRIGVTVVLFLVAASLNAGFWYAGADPRTWQYQFFPSTLVYFLAGSLAFRLYLLVRHLSYAKAIGYFVVPSMVISGWLLFTPRPDWWWTNNLYVFGYYAACAALIPFLFNTSKNSKIDRFIGDLSYPFYVVHMPVIWMVKSIAGETDIAKIATVVISLLLALILASAIDRPLDAWRGSKA